MSDAVTNEALFHPRHNPNQLVRARVRAGTQDWSTLFSCIEEDEYQFPEHLGEGDLVVDIGAHVGGFALLALSQGCQVLAVEALPENSAEAMANAALNGWTHNLLLHGSTAIGARSRSQFLIGYGDTSTESGAVHQFIGSPALPGHKGRVLSVPTISLDDLLAPFERVAFLKIDCEGGEWEAFRYASPATLDKIDRIAAELHPFRALEDQPAGISLRAAFSGMLGSSFSDLSPIRFGDQASQGISIGLAYYLHVRVMADAAAD